MKCHFCSLLLAGALLASPQVIPTSPSDTKPVRLPNGKLQSEEVLKSDHERNLKDAAELMKLSEEISMELEKNDRHVLSIGTLKKLEQVEKLARSLRSRMKRF